MGSDVEEGSLTEIAVLQEHLRNHPKDWESWLVYADALSDRGDIRGELIALERKKLSLLRSIDREPLTHRIAEIEKKSRRKWLSGLQTPRGTSYDWQFGFIFGVRYPWNKDIWSAFSRLSAHPTARFLTSLDLSGHNIGFAGARTLARAEPLRVIHALRLEMNNLDSKALVEILSSDFTGALKTLDLAHNPLETDGIRALSGAHRPFHALGLSGCGVDAAGASILGTSPLLQSLYTLNLSLNRIDSEGIQALVRSNIPSSLHTLTLSANGITDEGAITLANAESLGELRELDLSNNVISDIGASALASSSALRSITRLRLQGNRLSEEQMAIFRASKTIYP